MEREGAKLIFYNYLHPSIMQGSGQIMTYNTGAISYWKGVKAVFDGKCSRFFPK